jgi:hypothetical protein
VRFGAYLFFFVSFSLVLFLSHASLLKLPYFWDEAGQFVPAALDVFRTGAWIAHSTAPNIHPPAVTAYLAAAWTLAGVAPAVTRAAMLLLASFGLLAAFLLAIELSKEARGTPALLAAAILCASPLFFAQSMLAQLDAPAMLFTSLALLWFLQDRIPLSAAACVALVLVKETGVAVPLVFFGWLAYERRWRDAAWFLAPAAALAAWIGFLALRTGSWAGNSGFLQYNVYYPLHPGRLTVSVFRRIYYLFFADLRWVGAAAVLYAWRRTRLFQKRSWRIAWLVAAAQVVCVTVLGGAVLNRYLLPLFPILFAAMAAGLSFYRRTARIACSVALLAGALAGNFINPPYPFAYDDNLAFADFVRLQQQAAAYLESRYPAARVCTAWPLSLELSRPELGFVTSRMEVQEIESFSGKTLAEVGWPRVDALVAYSRRWDPPRNLLRFGLVRSFWSRLYGDVLDGGEEEALRRVPFPCEKRFERRGQWLEIYINPRMPGLRRQPVQTASAPGR